MHNICTQDIPTKKYSPSLHTSIYTVIMLSLPHLLSAAVKPLLQLCLLTIFLVFFGWPSLLRYREEAVMVITHVQDTGGMEAPAITMASRQGSTKPKTFIWLKLSS